MGIIRKGGDMVFEMLRKDMERINRLFSGEHSAIGEKPIVTVKTDARLFYRYLTEREIEWRERKHPLTLSDVTALGSHYGSFPISETELDALVQSTPLEPEKWGAHHKVWVGRWELGMSWDRKLVTRRLYR